MRNGTILAFSLLCTGLDLPAQDITNAPQVEVESAGVTCIALAVFAEARGRSWLEQALVARAIVNRQAELPDDADACDVVLAKGYAPALEAWPYPRRPWLVDDRAWQQAIEVTQVVLADDYAFPRACVGATRFTSAPTPSSAGPGSPCVVGALSFSGPGQ